LPLYAGKSEPGLFPNTSTAKPAAQKSLADGLLRVVAMQQPKGKPARELYGLTDAGWEFLLAQVNPKQVLEDFVRVIEARQGEVGELLSSARSMAASLQGLKEAVTRVLPNVTAIRLPCPAATTLVGLEPETTAEGRLSALSTPTPGGELDSRSAPIPEPVAVIDHESEAELDSSILSRLADWSGAAGEDCPLPELYRSLSLLSSPPTIGEFHDCLRRLRADGAIHLHSWTGPLYAVPEPEFALLAGHGIAYYASLK
jgi:DNA-binding PadR family transcriptional regulator